MSKAEQAAVYVRVSSEMQLDGRSLDEQERTCRAFCERNGLEVVKLYRDEAKSASTTDRPEFQRMLADARTGAFAAIVFYHTWRFSRNTEDGALMRRLEAGGIRLVSVSEGIDSKTASGKLQRNVTLAIGEYQLDQLREATRGGKQARAREGLTNASKPPYGYRRVFEVKDAATKQIVGRDVPSDDAPAVAQMFSLFATGKYAARELADWLNAQGRLTPNGRPFSKDTVLAMLRNGFYAGFVSYRGLSDRKSADGKKYLHNSKRATVWTPGAHEPIISRDLFEQCQQVMARRRASFLGGQQPARQRVYLFAKMAYCAHCGGRLRGSRWGKAGETWEDNAYRCTATERGCTCGAKYRMVPERELLPDLEGIIDAMRLPEDLKAEAMQIIEGRDTTGAVDRQAAKLESELQRLNRMYQAGNVTDDYYDRESARINAELAGLAPNTQPSIDIEAAIAMLDNMPALWRAATPEEKAEIVRSVFEAFKVDLNERRLHSFKPKNEYAALLRTAYYISGSDGRQVRVSHMRHTSPSRLSRVRSKSSTNSGWGLMPAILLRSVSTTTAAQIACTISRRMYLLAVGQICRRRTMRSPASTVRAGAGITIFSTCSFSARARRSMAGRSSSSTMPALIW
jgi:DNA invertase Pin-like site-specific DNA recombinase